LVCSQRKGVPPREWSERLRWVAEDYFAPHALPHALGFSSFLGSAAPQALPQAEGLAGSCAPQALPQADGFSSGFAAPHALPHALGAWLAKEATKPPKSDLFIVQKF
jgi:hypothetical protein